MHRKTLLPSILLVGLGGVAAAVAARAADRAPQPGHPVMELRPIELKPNLLPNASFETVEGTTAQHWVWGAGPTDATLTVDQTVAHSGTRSVHLTNSTPFAPHIFGMLSLAGGMAVKPDTVYTFSCYVKGEQTGVAWFGGGQHWNVRAHFPRNTHGQWARVVLSFTTDKDETQMPVLLLTESPTKGFWVDDVQLVEGPRAMPFFDAQQADSPRIELESPAARVIREGDKVVKPDWNTTDFPRRRYLFTTRDLWLRGWLFLPRGLTDARLATRLVAADGQTLGGEAHHPRLEAGTYLFELGHRVEDFVGGDVGLNVSLEGTGATDEQPVRLQAALQRRLITTANAEAVLGRVETLREELRRRVDSLRQAGRDPAYPLATLTILENFVGYAREDIGHGELARAYDAAVQMEAMARQALERDFLPPVPRYVTAPQRPGFRLVGPSQRGTVRWPDGHTETEWPLQFVGVGHFAQVKRDIEKLPGYGLNIIQIEFGPRSVLTGEDQVDTTTIEQYLKIFDRAAKADVAVNLLISPHYFPAWAYAKWPHLKDAGGGCLQVDVQAPEARAVYEKFLRTVIPRICHHPALHSICLTNEPVFTDARKSRFVGRRWHDWLRRRHGTIAVLNRRWGSDYADFESIAVPPPEFQPTPLVYDFICFNQETFAEFHAWMASIIRELAPDLPLHAKIMVPAVFVRHRHGAWSVSPELFAALSDYNGNDAWKYPSGRGPWASAWWDENMGYDLQRSVADKPIFNSENHLIPDRTFDVVAPSHIANVFWQGAIHGQAATTTWVWERTYAYDSVISGSIMHRPRCVEAMGHTALDLMRLAKEMTAFEQLPIQVALVWSPASLVAGQEYVDRLRQTYEALDFCGFRVGFVTERQLAGCARTGRLPGPLNAVKVIVATGVVRTPGETLEALGKFSAEGGRVILLSECFTHDEYGRPREVPSALPPPAELPATGEETFQFFQSRLSSLPVQRLVTVALADGKPAWGVEYLAARLDGRLLVNLANYLSRPQQVRIMRDGKAVTGIDLRTGRTLGETFDLAPLEPLLLEIRQPQ